MKWRKCLREAGIANTAAVEEGVGRLSFIAGMLEYDRPFLSAICRFLAVEERDVVRPLPAYALFSLRFSPNVITSIALPPSSLSLSSESRRTDRRRNCGDRRMVA